MQGTTGPLATFPRRLLAHAQVRPTRPAYREKQFGIWQVWSWAETADAVRAMACGLAALGFRRGMRLAIVGDNRPRLYWAMLAAQSLGGIPVPLYQDALAADMAYVFSDAGIDFALVEDQEQTDKLLALRSNGQGPAHIAYDDPRGLRHYTQPGLQSIDALIENGKAYDSAHPGFFEQQVELGQAGDPAIILYTSGTTGKPKGVVQSHRALLTAGEGGVGFDRLNDCEDILSYLPMAWVGDCLFSLAQALVAGFTVNCPESSDTAMADMREIGPTYYFAPPRIFENLLTNVMIRIEDAGAVKRRMFHHFMDVARRCGADIMDGKKVPLADRIQYAIGHVLVYGPLRNVLGMSRIRVAYTAGAAIGPDLFRFYRSIGVNLKQLYGSTETCAYVCFQPDSQISFDTVGQPAPGVEVKLAPNGEVLVRSPALMDGYYGNPHATAEAIDSDGYFHTGDAGVFDAHGQLRIIDRAADVGQLSDGGMFAPNYIENKLKFFPYIKEAVTFGHGRTQVCAFLNIDMDAVGDWAERRNIAWSSYTDLAAHPATYALMRECVSKVNASLAAEAGMAHTAIRRFLVLHKELDPDDGELTRTRKVRRAFIAEKYEVLVSALFNGKQTQDITTEVRFEDGRRGSIRADLRIEDMA